MRVCYLPPMRILSVATAHPAHRYEQDELIAAFEQTWAQEHHNVRRVAQLHKAVQVGGRWLALPMERYLGLTFGQANQAFIDVGTDIAAEALQRALDAAGLSPTDVDHVLFTSVTGIAAPSIDARLVNRLGMRPDVKRVPMFGLGCVAGAAGVARLHDYLRAYPDQVAVLVSVELCSLTLQRKDLSIANLIASGLFGDGAAAVVGVGTERAASMELDPARVGPEVLATRSRFYPDTEQVMGWDIGETGFKIVLSPEVPDMVHRFMGDDLAAFLRDVDVHREDVRTWVCHPGGPKVLLAFEDALGLERHDLQLTWDSLQQVGNLSSASVLHVLKDTMEHRRAPAGTHGMMLAMGPGFCSEFVLLRW